MKNECLIMTAEVIQRALSSKYPNAKALTYAVSFSVGDMAFIVEPCEAVHPLLGGEPHPTGRYWIRPLIKYAGRRIIKRRITADTPVSEILRRADEVVTLNNKGGAHEHAD